MTGIIHRLFHRHIPEDKETPMNPDNHEDIDLYSSSMEVFTDFNQQQPFLLEQSVGIDAATELMKKAHVRLKLVIDHEEHFRGVISLADLLSVKVMRAMKATGLMREDLTVADVMTHKDALRAIEMDEFRRAKIGDVLQTMKRFGEQHVLVVDSADQSIRGIVSSSDTVRRLHVPVHISERANSFSDIYNAVHP